MHTLKIVEGVHALYSKIEGATEHVYTAVEFDTATGENLIDLVCYRTKDNMTHLAEVTADGFVVRKSVPKF